VFSYRSGQSESEQQQQLNWRSDILWTGSFMAERGGRAI
jgi:hypothetical protein